MGKTKTVRRGLKRILNPKDARLQHKKKQQQAKQKGKKGKNTTGQVTADGQLVRAQPKISSAMFFRYNSSLGPPFQVLVDTNFVNFSIQNKLDPFKSFMDCLLAKVTPIITDCVLGEIEKAGPKWRVALRICKDPRFKRLKCTHKGTYADDCLVNRVQQHKCYIVATCDRDLRRRIRKIPGVPIMYISQRKYTIERFADVNNAPA